MLKRGWLAVLAVPGALAACACLAGEVSVEVTDPGAKPAPNLAITLTRLPPAASAPPVAAVMDQVNRHFVPELLIIPVGSTVAFPNTDLVSHQVYSFSDANRFQLPLYRGRPYPPVHFDKPGLIVVGCNIHDSMIGYIVVTTAPYYGLTDGAGRWSARAVAEGDYELRVYHPRMRLPSSEITRRIHVDAQSKQQLALALGESLRSAPLQGNPRQWDY